MGLKTIFAVLLLPVFCLGVSAQENLHQLEDITVTGTRGEKRLKDSPVVTEVISAEEIENSGADTVTEILEDYGVVYTNNFLGANVQLQGLGEGRVLYLVNGRRVVGRIAQRLNGDTMPLSNVERIEIIRGPQSAALYGSDSIGGVINIITKKPGDEFSLSAGLSNSFLLAHDTPDNGVSPGPFEDFNPIREQNLTALIGIPLGPTRNSLNLEGSRGALYLDEDGDKSLLPEYYRGKVGLDTAFPLGDVEFSAGGSFMAMRSGEQTSAARANDISNYIRADGYVEAELFPLENGALTLRLYDNYYRREKDAYNTTLNSFTIGEEYENITALEAIGVYDGLDNFMFTVGVEGTLSFMDKYNLTLNNDGTFAMVDKEALYVQAEYYKEDRYSLILGLRGERNSKFGFGGSPKLSAMFHLPGGFRILGGAGLGYRAPDFSELYLVKDDFPPEAGNLEVRGNPDLKPEYALSFNLALEYSKEGLCYVQVNGYYTELFNEIMYPGWAGRGPPYPPPVIYTTKNIPRSLRTGVDIEGRLNFLTNFFLSAGYSWLYAYDRTEGEAIHPQSAHTVKGKLGWDHKKSGIHTYLQGRFFSAPDPFFSSPDSPSLPPLITKYTNDSRFIMDFYFSIRFADHFKVHASVDNLTGLVNPWLGPTVGRVFTVGLNYTL
jgi:outer membrane receptor for ferrienterochelin and colicins